ncbi:TonB-dependent receptor [Ravibacter arvi]|uniref:TonB-dependent receptor n=1 Tax=Ravibacter arvi TaxID=2051041 RepID=A0ABP8M2L4_9BACT
MQQLGKSPYKHFAAKLALLAVLLVLFSTKSSVAIGQLNQRVLDRNVTLKAEKLELRQVLRQIEEQAKVKFAYSEKNIDTRRRVSISVTGQTLGEALAQLLKPLQIEFSEVSGRILLTPARPDEMPDLQRGETRMPLPGRQVSGTVTDEKGEPLPGVNIMVKGTQRGTSTDIEGRFQIDVEDPASVLILSFVGFVSQEIIVGSRSSITVVMKEDPKNLEEVIVVGFGQQKKVSVTGAVSVVSSDEIKQTSSASLAVALAGKLPGLTSLQSGGGQPGRDDAIMYLRGAATLNTTAPLILIDGVPRENIRTIDPNEVESISVLKDASATAVFGVRGANGVIIITTKRGTNGKTSFNVTAEQTFSSFTKEPERLHSVDYMALRNQALANDKLPILYTEDVIEKYRNPLAGLDPNAPDYAEQKRIREYMYPDHDYYRELFKRYSPQTRINVGASGGTDKIGYFINGTYLHQGGNLKTEPKSTLGYDPSSWMDRYSFRSNLDYKMTSFLKSFLNIGAYIEKVNMPAAWLYGGGDTNWMMSDLFYQAQTILPITPGPVTIEGFGVAPGQIVDPGYMDRSAFEIMNRFGYRNEVRSNLNSTFGMELDLGQFVTPGLSVKGMVSYDAISTTAMQAEKTERLFLTNLDIANNTFTYATKRPDERLISLVKGADSRYNINIQGTINYARTFDEKHDLTVMFLGQRDNWESTLGEIPFNVLGVAGRFTYAYDNRYLAEFNMGYNGSEQFSPAKRFGFFPAASIGWVASNEAFLKSSQWLTNLKFRASFGKVGNDRMVGTRFLYLDNITVGGGPLGSLGMGQGIDQGLLGNPNITWEVAEKKNLGIDVELFRNLSLTFDYFTERRSQILIARGLVPALQGVPISNLPRVNMGKVDNKGFELELTYNKAIGSDFTFTARGNFGMNRNKVIYADEPKRDGSYIEPYLSTGLPMATNFGYRIDYSNGNGYFNTQEELDTYLKTTKYAFGTPRLGDFIYKDLNQDGTVDDKDVQRIGWSRIPGVIYGLTLSLNYKGFGLMAFFQGLGRYSQTYGNQGVWENIIRGTYFGYHRTAWTPERYAAGEEITYPALSTLQNTNHRANDFFVMNKAFTRIRNAEVSYELPRKLLDGIGVKDMRLYLSGQNLFTWNKLKMDHLDPENTNSIGYPVTRTMNLGVNLTF